MLVKPTPRNVNLGSGRFAMFNKERDISDLINGRLVKPFVESVPVSRTYWIVCPKASSTLPKIVTFRDWLLSEAAADLRKLKALGSSKSTKRRAI